MNNVISVLVTVGSSSVAATVVGSFFATQMKRVEKLNSEKLEHLRDLLAQHRDYRQARIGLGRFATERSLEIEFKALQDIHASLVHLDFAHSSVRPFFNFRP